LPTARRDRGLGSDGEGYVGFLLGVMKMFLKAAFSEKY
jgi:hypothetical protein